MNERILRTLLVILMSAVCAGQVHANPVVSILPADQVIEGPGSFSATLRISGLHTDNPSLLLGGFSLDLVFDPAVLTYLPFPPAGWGGALGNVATGEALSGIDSSTPGILRLSEVSLLEADPDTCLLCSGPFLKNLQGSSFNLLTLRFFDAASSGSTQLQIANALFADADGNPITLDATNGATVRVPEPGNLAMIGLGMAAMACLRRRRHSSLS
jgi:hypothetical protein